MTKHETEKKPEKEGIGGAGTEPSAFSQFSETPKDVPHPSLGARLRTNFLTGLIIVGPISITFYILWWFINLVDAWFRPLFDTWFRPILTGWIKPAIAKLMAWLLPEGFQFTFELPFEIPGIGLIFAIFLLMSVGALAANLFGRTLVSLGEQIMERMPVVRNVYRAIKQIFETVLSSSNNSFQKVGIIEYPRRGIYSIVFISTETTGEISHKFENEDGGLLSIFLPTTPNPTSGFLLFVPRRDVTILDMTVEDAAKLVISAGLVVPEYDASGKVASVKPATTAALPPETEEENPAESLPEAQRKKA